RLDGIGVGEGGGAAAARGGVDVGDVLHPLAAGDEQAGKAAGDRGPAADAADVAATAERGDVVARRRQRRGHAPGVRLRVVLLGRTDIPGGGVAADRVEAPSRSHEGVAAAREMHRGDLGPAVSVQAEDAGAVAPVAVPAGDVDVVVEGGGRGVV